MPTTMPTMTDRPWHNSPNLVLLDGYPVWIEWHQMVYGDSFFVPSVAWATDRGRLKDAAESAGVLIGAKGVVENGIRGVRVWCLGRVI